MASDLGDIPVDAYQHTKAQLRAPVVARPRESGGVDSKVRQLWGTDQTQQRLAAYLERL